MMTQNLRAWLSLAVLVFVMGLLVFGPAGSVWFWQGWTYLAVFFGASALITQYLIKNDPALLERRLTGGPTAEKESTQRLIMLFASLGFVALLVVPALDHRFGWSQAPTIVELAGDALVAGGFFVIFLVFKENSYASSTIGVAEGQTLVSTGPYAIVRHPMYAGALLYLAGTPLALGSYWGFAPLALMLPFLIWRLLDEERVLEERLPGYSDYRKAVRYRLAPGLY
jgi:protein-S-isoprenylcysteine O-methyltransferase Ste14